MRYLKVLMFLAAFSFALGYLAGSNPEAKLCKLPTEGSPPYVPPQFCAECHLNCNPNLEPESVCNEYHIYNVPDQGKAGPKRRDAIPWWCPECSMLS